MKTVLTQYYPELRLKTIRVFDTDDKGYNKMIDCIDTVDAKIFSIDEALCRDQAHLCDQIAHLLITGAFIPVGRLAKNISHPAPVTEHRITAAPCDTVVIDDPVNPLDDDEDGALPEFTDHVENLNGEEVPLE